VERYNTFNKTSKSGTGALASAGPAFPTSCQLLRYLYLYRGNAMRAPEHGPLTIDMDGGRYCLRMMSAKPVICDVGKLKVAQLGNKNLEWRCISTAPCAYDGRGTPNYSWLWGCGVQLQHRLFSIYDYLGFMPTLCEVGTTRPTETHPSQIEVSYISYLDRNCRVYRGSFFSYIISILERAGIFGARRGEGTSPAVCVHMQCRSLAV